MSANIINQKFVNYTTFTSTYDAVPTITDLSMNLLNAAQTSSVENFSHYKLNAIKFEFVPLSNSIGITAIGATATTEHALAPTMLTLFINNRDETYSSYESVSNNPRHKNHNSMRTVSRYAKLKPQIDVAMGVTAVTYTAPNRYISTGDLDAVYGRFLVIPQPSDVDIPITHQSSQTYRVKTTHFVQLKNMNVN